MSFVTREPGLVDEPVYMVSNWKVPKCKKRYIPHLVDGCLLSQLALDGINNLIGDSNSCCPGSKHSHASVS
jgi:hypothetical protein